jgi:predicted nucleic acid-binding protein
VRKYVLDTNLYVRAIRDLAEAEELARFYSSHAPYCYLNSVVLHELLVGANRPEKHRQIRQDIARPFEKTGRMITPGHRSWEVAGGTLARMGREQGLDLRRVSKSLAHDVLIAASCREAGVTLITDNEADFHRIQAFLRFEFLPPWPV